MSVLKRLLKVNDANGAQVETAQAVIKPRYPAADESVVTDAAVAKAMAAKRRRKPEEFNLMAIRSQVGATGARAVFGLLRDKR